MYARVGKRAMDTALAALALLVLAPVYALVATLVRLRLGAPVLFRQVRPGQHGRLLVLYKFRTMTDARDDEGRLLGDDERLTGFGRWLRSASLDELPELINVLRGEMSLVGPRPLLVCYLDRYTPEQMRRHEVKPGITGWAQINGRNNLTWEKKLDLDVWYVEHQSLWLDVQILALTIWRVLRRDGINCDGYATAPEFRGTATGQTEWR